MNLALAVVLAECGLVSTPLLRRAIRRLCGERLARVAP
jgi:hypothetical protein